MKKALSNAGIASGSTFVEAAPPKNLVPKNEVFWFLKLKVDKGVVRADGKLYDRKEEESQKC